MIVTSIDTRDPAVLDQAVEDDRRHAIVTDISAGGAAIEHELPKPAGLCIGATACLAIKPSESPPTFDRERSTRRDGSPEIQAPGDRAASGPYHRGLRGPPFAPARSPRKE